MSAHDHDTPKSAVALRYDSASASAPQVTAKGRGDVAEQILCVARANGVPIREDKDLVALLSACELLDDIPVELYTAVAHVLAYLHALNQELAGSPRPPSP
ncbi:MAG: EscU/YscU/HrcU family type III secretion system export apparatus switch protein [Planctomycetota bacterium]|nr:EscU/YscU/HrcU family type III secretion system export apparatus switch protein [Planctomycetota bacterium]